MYLYLYEGEDVRGKAGELLVKQALAMYIAEEGREEPESMPEILRTENGKPYFEGEGLPYFSVSHSGQLWVCLMAEFPVGIDIQEETKADIKGIAERYFSQDEKVYADIYDREGFYRLWTYKEAYTKLRGESIFENVSKTSLIDDDSLVKSLNDDQFGEVYFKDVEIGAGITLSVCVAKDEDIWLRLLEQQI